MASIDKKEAQHSVVCKLVDHAVMSNRASMSSSVTTRQLVKLDNMYSACFKGEKGSTSEHRLDFIVRFHRIVEVDGRLYQVPDRISQQFVTDVKAALPDAKVVMGAEISYG